MSTPLHKFFVLAWEAFLDRGSWDDEDLQIAIELAGLGRWREATEADVANTDCDLEVGDPVMVLTEAGKEAISAVRAEAPAA